MNRIAKKNLLFVFVCVTIVYLIIACAQSPVVTEQSPVVTEQSPVIINEIMFSVPWGPKGDANGDGIRSPRSDEFIELVNAGDTAVDIGGWQILQKKLDVIFTFRIRAGRILCRFWRCRIWWVWKSVSFRVEDFFVTTSLRNIYVLWRRRPKALLRI